MRHRGRRRRPSHAGGRLLHARVHRAPRPGRGAPGHSRRTGRPWASAPGHHRPVRGRVAADAVPLGLRGRPERRDLQLPRAPRRARQRRSRLPHGQRHRGAAGGLRPLGRRMPRSPERDVRLRPVRPRATHPPAGSGSVRGEAALLPPDRGRYLPLCVGDQGAARSAGGPGTAERRVDLPIPSPQAGRARAGHVLRRHRLPAGRPCPRAERGHGAAGPAPLLVARRVGGGSATSRRAGGGLPRPARGLDPDPAPGRCRGRLVALGRDRLERGRRLPGAGPPGRSPAHLLGAVPRLAAGRGALHRRRDRADGRSVARGHAEPQPG